MKLVNINRTDNFINDYYCSVKLVCSRMVPGESGRQSVKLSAAETYQSSKLQIHMYMLTLYLLYTDRVRINGDVLFTKKFKNGLLPLL